MQVIVLETRASLPWNKSILNFFSAGKLLDLEVEIVYFYDVFGHLQTAHIPINASLPSHRPENFMLRLTVQCQCKDAFYLVPPMPSGAIATNKSKKQIDGNLRMPRNLH